MNFIVMMILSLVMLGVGFYFAKTIFLHTTDIGQQLDYQTKQQLESKLRDPSALVAIGVNQKTIKRNGHDTFGVGIANRDKQEGYFYLEVACILAQIEDEEGNKIEDGISCKDKPELTCCNEWIMGKDSGGMISTYSDQTISAYKTDIGILKPNEFKIGQIFLNVNKKARPGRYVYNVQVRKRPVTNNVAGGTPENYDSVKKIYIEVP